MNGKISQQRQVQGEHGRGRKGGKLKTTPRRKEDSDWMHDPGGKNRFSKLSYVERTAAALSVRRQTIRTLPFSLLSSPSFTFSTWAGNSESGRYHNHIRGRGTNIPFRGICPFHLPRDIFGSGRTNRKAAGSYIVFILQDELQRYSSFATEILPRQSLDFFHWPRQVRRHDAPEKHP